jgi:hypothetical protein
MRDGKRSGLLHEVSLDAGSREGFACLGQLALRIRNILAGVLYVYFSFHIGQLFGTIRMEVLQVSTLS